MSTPARSEWPENLTGARDRLLGSTVEVHYAVTPADSVRCLAGRSIEFLRKPNVVASARLLELCEWPCMEAIGKFVADGECSLGARQELDHRAPIAIGARLAITALCTVACHRYSKWEVDVHDGHENVGRATLTFVVVDLAAFEQRHLAPKTAPLCNAEGQAARPPPASPRPSRSWDLNPGTWT